VRRQMSRIKRVLLQPLELRIQSIEHVSCSSFVLTAFATGLTGLSAPRVVTPGPS
jgi:hypothetical protein